MSQQSPDPERAKRAAELLEELSREAQARQHPSDTALLALTAGTLAPAARAGLEEHLSRCGLCRGAADAQRFLHELENATTPDWLERLWRSAGGVAERLERFFAEALASGLSPAPAQAAAQRIGGRDGKHEVRGRLLWPGDTLAADTLFTLEIEGAAPNGQSGRPVRLLLGEQQLAKGTFHDATRAHLRLTEEVIRNLKDERLEVAPSLLTSLLRFEVET